jgi:DNA-binding PadR family transcriptional regulator
VGVTSVTVTSALWTGRHTGKVEKTLAVLCAYAAEQTTKHWLTETLGIKDSEIKQIIELLLKQEFLTADRRWIYHKGKRVVYSITAKGQRAVRILAYAHFYVFGREWIKNFTAFPPAEGGLEREYRRYQQERPYD